MPPLILQRLYLKDFRVQTALQSPLLDERGKDSFSLKTCQRHLFLDLKKIDVFSVGSERNEDREEVEFSGQAAYHYLLEVICGIRSRVLAENEIVGQFKEAYREYLKRENRNSDLIVILEKLLKDAKEVRSQHLEGIGQKTYASISRKLIFEKSVPPKILVIGTGKLAFDVVKKLKKKVEKVFISSRNSSKVEEFCQLFSVFPLGWEDFDLYKEFPFIVNTVGIKERGDLFNHDFFLSWSRLHNERLFVDLGSPSSIETSLGRREGVVRLDSIFERSTLSERNKREKIEAARKTIEMMSQKRNEHFIRPKRELQFV